MNFLTLEAVQSVILSIDPEADPLPAATMHHLGFDSLDNVELVMELEMAFDIDLGNADDINGDTTVAQLCTIVEDAQ